MLHRLINIKNYVSVGGDKSNLKCKSDNVSDSEGSNRVLGNATTTLNLLSNCSAIINNSCSINETLLGIDMEEFDNCGKENDELIKLIDGEQRIYARLHMYMSVY